MSGTEIVTGQWPDGPIKSLPDIVHDVLRREIISGAIGPGEPLKQAHIAARLGLSRAPVREALQRLEREGLAVFRSRRGYTVANLDTEEVEDIFAMRIWLEGRTCHLATSRRTPADVAALESVLAKMDECTKSAQPDFAEWAGLNREFHMRLFQVSGRPQLCKMALALLDSVERYVWFDHSKSEGLEIAQTEHRRILDAFRDGDADRVKALSREHCQNTRERLIASLGRNPK
jgi:DNA-binding GntR family transcriptional regulator